MASEGDSDTALCRRSADLSAGEGDEPSAGESCILNLEAFLVEVDAVKGIVAQREFAGFEQLLEQVLTLYQASSADAASSPRTLVPESSHAENRPQHALRPQGPFGSVGTLDAVDVDLVVNEPAVDQHAKGFTWVNLQTTAPEDIARLGKACKLHSLTVEDIANDFYEKTELFARRGYLYCMLDSEDMYGNSVHIHVLLFRGWVLTIHNRASAAIQRTLHRLTEEFTLDPHHTQRRMAEDECEPCSLAHPSWIPYTLADIDVDWIMAAAEMLVQEAQDTDEVLLTISSKEQPDVLRRISMARSRIYTQRQRTFSKQRLLMSLSSSSMEGYMAPHLKLYLRDVVDHILWCSKRLDSAQEVLSQANANYLACIGIETSQVAQRTNILLGRLTLLTVAVIPFNLFAGLFGMNVEVPMRDVPGLGPWCAIVFTGTLLCTLAFIILFRLDQQRYQKEQ